MRKFYYLFLVVLLLGFQNCGSQLLSPWDIYEQGSSEMASHFGNTFNPFSLAPDCLGASHTTMIDLGQELYQRPQQFPTTTTNPELLNNKHSDSRPIQVDDGVFSHKVRVDRNNYNRPIEFVIDKSFYYQDPENPELAFRFKELVQSAIDMWEDAIGIDIFNIIDINDNSGMGGVSLDGYSTIYWNKNDSIPSKVRGATAFACSMFTNSGVFVEGDIVINAFRNNLFFECFNCSDINSPVQNEFERRLNEIRSSEEPAKYKASHFTTILAHELGHVLGFTHSLGDSESIMKPVFQSYEIISELSDEDVQRYHRLKNYIRAIRN